MPYSKTPNRYLDVNTGAIFEERRFGQWVRVSTPEEEQARIDAQRAVLAELNKGQP